MGAIAFGTQLVKLVHFKQKLDTESLQKYRDLIDHNIWAILQNKFVKEFCKLQGRSQESNLYLISKASTLALPKISKVMQHLKSRQHDFNTMTELPIDSELGRDFKFHNIFMCPVAKEISTKKDNPPCLLVCGHLISKTSLNKMTRGQK